MDVSLCRSHCSRYTYFCFAFFLLLGDVQRTSAEDDGSITLETGPGSSISFSVNSVSAGALEALIQYDVKDPAQLAKVCKPLLELMDMVKFVKENKPVELKDLLTKTSCEDKTQWTQELSGADVSSIFTIKHSSVISLILASVASCPPVQVHATRTRFFLGVFSTKRGRDITEVLVTVSGSEREHKDYFNEIEGCGYQICLRCSLAEGKEALAGVKALCFELMDLIRTAPVTAINVQEAAEQLKAEMDAGWMQKSVYLNKIMMQTPAEDILKIVDEFKTLNGGAALDDAFAKQFEADTSKLNTYKQLLSLVRDKIVYFAEEIQTRIVDNDEYSLRIANAIAMTGTLAKADRDKLDAVYKEKNNNVGLFEELDKLSTTSGLEDVTGQTLKLLVEDLKNKPN